MSAKFSVLWSNNTDHTRPMSRHTFRLRDLGLPLYDNVTVHVDQVNIIFRPNTAIGPDEYVAPDTDKLTWHAETDNLLLRCTPGVRHPLYVGDDPATGSAGNPVAHTRDDGHDTGHVQRVCTYSAALATTWNQVGDESYWCRSYRPIRDLPVLVGGSNLSEWTLELIFPFLLGDSQMARTSVPDYRIQKVYVEFSVRW